jgi:hypothetical protein
LSHSLQEPLSSYFLAEPKFERKYKRDLSPAD